MKQRSQIHLGLTGSVLAFVAFGCGHVKIQDPEVLQAAGAVGESSAALVQTRHAEDAGAVEDRARDVELALVALALAHDDWVTERDEIRLDAVDGSEQVLSWRDGRLQGGLALDGGGHLVSSLRFMGNRTEHADLSGGMDAVCQGGEANGSSDGVWCPPFVDRALRLERPVEVNGVPMWLRLVADYGLYLDGRGCSAGGQVDVTYVLSSGRDRPYRGGFVSADFQGCGTARASTIER